MEGKLENFDPTKVKQPTSVTLREVRKLFKCTIAKFQLEEARRAEERRNNVRSEPKQTDCLRCMLIERGNIMISGSIVYVCKFKIPEGYTILEDETTPANISDEEPSSEEYVEILAKSIALGNVEQTPPIEKSQPPSQLIVERRIHIKREPEFETNTHICNPSIQPQTLDVPLLLDTDRLKKGKADYAVIYAAPGLGKTTMQYVCAKRGLAILDTDDIPNMTKSKLKGLLSWTSVLTNRLDLLDPSAPTVAFVPESKVMLREKTQAIMDLSDDDLDYWISVHDFSQFTRVIECRVRNSYITDWFHRGLKKKPRRKSKNKSLEREFLEFTKKVLE
ncbi:hypothetical protein ILUMI_01007 [Ignelater luminosus]|uniref:Uncharacterized protein n=1 Tax=Ignelater luminosus TaxID=2038154 RepID=A0A8K0DRJ9_IGNLU|nr:hypothetical protein ILUMI_01007 [Ignelater luminosus]